MVQPLDEEAQTRPTRVLDGRGVLSLGLVVAALVLTACSSHRVHIADASTMADGRTLQLIVDSCNADLSAELDESPTRVTVTVTARNETNDDCLDGLVVRLEQPLSDRRLIDGATGRPVPVRQDQP